MNRKDVIVYRFLLLLPFVGLMSVPFYNRQTPEWFGFPFFYGFQFVWVPITSLLTYFVYRMDKNRKLKNEKKNG